MEENKFERQVQQKMDELRIHPPDSVWEKIEARLEKKKPSNRRLLFFLLFFCVLLAGGYFVWNSRQNAVITGNNLKKNYSEKNVSEIPAIKNNDPGKINTATPGLITKKTNSIESTPVKNDINKNYAQQHQHLTGKKIISINPGEETTAAFAKQQELKEEVSENTVPEPGTPQPLTMQPGNEKIRAEIKDSEFNQFNRDTLSTALSSRAEKPAVKQEAIVKDTLGQIQAAIATVKHTKNKKWKLGITFSGGISGVGSNFLGLKNSTSFDYLNLNVIGSVNGSITMPLAPPSRTKSEFGFIAGIIAEKDISARIQLVTGINFKSFNTSNTVGMQNSVYRFYSSQNSGSTYKSHYNFVDLPVALKARLTKEKSLPLFWQGGFVISRLISSNALQFNTGSGFYYSNNSIFNKTQIGLNTALSVALLSKRKYSLLIGPYFYYSASALANEGLYNKKHFIFTGLRTEIVFGK